MTGWQIGLEYLRTLAWPLVVIFIVWRFKAQAGRLFDRLLSLQTPVGTAEFDRQAREVSIDAQEATLVEGQREQRAEDDETKAISDSTPPEQVPAATNGHPNETQPDRVAPRRSGILAAGLRAWTADEFQMYRDRAGTDPTSAVLGAWRRVEQFADLVLRDLGQVERWSSPSAMLKQLRQIGLATHFVQIADDLRRLRNTVAHGGNVQITPSGALDYIDAAERVADALAVLASSRSAGLGDTLTTKEDEPRQASPG